MGNVSEISLGRHEGEAVMNGQNESNKSGGINSIICHLVTTGLPLCLVHVHNSHALDRLSSNETRPAREGQIQCQYLPRSLLEDFLYLWQIEIFVGNSFVFLS